MREECRNEALKPHSDKMPPLAIILIYAVAAAAQWQGHGSRARHAALDAALTAYPEIHARETEKLKSGDPIPDGVPVFG